MDGWAGARLASSAASSSQGGLGAKAGPRADGGGPPPVGSIRTGAALSLRPSPPHPLLPSPPLPSSLPHPQQAGPRSGVPAPAQQQPHGLHRRPAAHSGVRDRQRQGTRRTMSHSDCTATHSDRVRAQRSCDGARACAHTYRAAALFLPCCALSPCQLPPESCSVHAGGEARAHVLTGGPHPPSWPVTGARPPPHSTPLLLRAQVLKKLDAIKARQLQLKLERAGGAGGACCCVEICRAGTGPVCGAGKWLWRGSWLLPPGCALWLRR